MPMRIGVDIRALQENKTTGVQVYILNLLHNLFRIDTQNQYLLFSNAARPVSVPPFDYPNVELRSFRYPSKFLAVSQKYFRRPRVDRLLGGLDVFFSPHWRTLALSSSVPLVVTFHDLSFELVPEFFTMRQRLWHKFMGYPAAAAAAARIVAVSENTCADLAELYGIPKEKITVVYPGTPALAAPEPLPGLPEKFFLAFGTFEPRKNLDAAIAAHAIYQNESKTPLPLVLAGSAGWKGQPRVPKETRGVCVYPQISEGQKSELYRRAFALLFLSFYEGFGFPVIEAAAAKVPVVASVAASLSEIAGDFALLVNPFRPMQAARAMLELERDPSLRQRLGEAGQEAAARFSWDRAARSVLTLFQELKK